MKESIFKGEARIQIWESKFPYNSRDTGWTGKSAGPGQRRSGGGGDDWDLGGLPKLMIRLGKFPERECK